MALVELVLLLLTIPTLFPQKFYPKTRPILHPFNLSTIKLLHFQQANIARRGFRIKLVLTGSITFYLSKMRS